LVGQPLKGVGSGPGSWECISDTVECPILSLEAIFLQEWPSRRREMIESLVSAECFFMMWWGDGMRHRLIPRRLSENY
jgi:hypothetical protein